MTNAPLTPKNKILSKRRLTLLASVAGLGAAVLLAGPGSHRPMNFTTWTSAAQAADSAQPSAGFADLVAKVKPAVILVRVKMDDTAQTTRMNQRRNVIPLQPGSPLEKFF